MEQDYWKSGRQLVFARVNSVGSNPLFLFECWMTTPFCRSVGCSYSDFRQGGAPICFRRRSQPRSEKVALARYVFLHISTSPYFSFRNPSSKQHSLRQQCRRQPKGSTRLLPYNSTAIILILYYLLRLGPHILATNIA